MWLIVCTSIGIVACELYREFEPNYEMDEMDKGFWLGGKHQYVPGTSSQYFFRSLLSEETGLNPNFKKTREKRAAPIYHLLGKSRKGNILQNVKSQMNEKKTGISLFSDFPSGVAMFLESYNNKNMNHKRYSTNEANISNIKNKTSALTHDIKAKNLKENHDNENGPLNDLKNIFEGNATDRRSVKLDELVGHRMGFFEILSKNKDIINKTQNRNNDQIWQTAPVNTNIYKIPPKEAKTKNDIRPDTVNRILKVLSMLIRTFWRIMKQKNAIEMICEDMDNNYKQFGKKLNINTKKLDNFDVRFMTMANTNDKLKDIQEYLKKKEEMYKNKESLLKTSLFNFKSQQKKFLAQQQQFYNIQKMILAHNKNINLKQNSITKMQNRISQRQTHYVRLLEKINQEYSI